MDSINKQTKIHSLNMENRKKLNMTGVEKVVSSSDNSILLETAYGGLTINGKNLKINKFNIDDGAFSTEGDIDAIKYTAPKVPVLKRLFR